MPLSPTNRWIVFVIGLIVALTFVACTTDAQRIEDANEAARLSGTPSGSTAVSSSESSKNIQRSGEISIFDIRDGDCFKSLPDNLVSETVEIIPCSEDWETRVVSSFVVDSVGKFPGIPFFWQQASNRCDRRYSYLFFPLEDSWKFGDRVVNCLQDLAGIDLTDIDRMVNVVTLREGECFNEAPETQFVSVELVDCVGDWEFQVLNTFKVTPNGPFPGEAYIDRQGLSNCDSETDFIYSPTAETWDAEGDRVVICTRVR